MSDSQNAISSYRKEIELALKEGELRTIVAMLCDKQTNRVTQETSFAFRLFRLCHVMYLF